MSDVSSESPGAPGSIELVGVSKSFGDVQAVDRVDLAVRSGEFFSMLGPSGSGKTTCLRMIAGFEHPTSGVVRLGGRDVNGVAPYARNVNTVFQDYALFPHMTVGENVEFGLRIRKVPRAQRRSRAADALALVRLTGFADRKPAQLSGGQRQRVALARALVNRPEVLLLDEPLGALDLKLREEMQFELKQIQREVGITFLYVTHDQDEALSMSDRLAVFNGGRIEQVGTPTEVYESPVNAFVAGFVGTSNVVSGAAARALRGSEAAFTVRPEKIRLGALEGAGSRATGTLRESVYLGDRTRYLVDLDAGGSLVVVEQNFVTPVAATHTIGERVSLEWQPDSERTVAESTAATTSQPQLEDQ